jgi:hypothetical protein
MKTVRTGIESRRRPQVRTDETIGVLFGASETEGDKRNPTVIGRDRLRAWM